MHTAVVLIRLVSISTARCSGTVAKETQQKYSHISTACRTIWREEGVRGFFRGYSTSAIIMPAFWALYFPVSVHIGIAASLDGVVVCLHLRAQRASACRLYQYRSSWPPWVCFAEWAVGSADSCSAACCGCDAAAEPGVSSVARWLYRRLAG